jgi:hypothetical protein
LGADQFPKAHRLDVPEDIKEVLVTGIKVAPWHAQTVTAFGTSRRKM